MQNTIKSFRLEHAHGFRDLQDLWSKLGDVEASLVELSETAEPFVADAIERSIERIRAFEPSVSIIGQVKAGKSTLVNALIGETDLLPSDVNPWTSVITNVHLNSRSVPEGARALFRFFDADEWDRLMETGGRLGEMANRAGFESEVSDVRSQVANMRQATEDRLGEEFEKLLDSSHAFPEISKDIIDRYICYGDPEDIVGGGTDGVFADLTKSADLFVDIEGYPSGLCVRDTPGVNDTFMMREQITLNAISESRVCVVVLSAHQALSNMDLALLRIICSVEAREVLIFVNRIDELADPKGETELIRKSIGKTLRKIGLGDEINIIFGSGYWANAALSGSASQMLPASFAGLEAYFADEQPDLSDPDVLRNKAMEASGIPVLHRAISKRVVEGPGEAFLSDMRTEIENIMSMNGMVSGLVRQHSTAGGGTDIEVDDIRKRLKDVIAETRASFETETGQLRENFRIKLERAQQSFVDSAVEALQSHIDSFGERESWSHDPSGLRMMMKSCYNVSCTKLRRIGETSVESIFDQIQDLLQFELDIIQDELSAEFPAQPQHSAPTALAMTLTLDLQASWWRRFFKGGRKDAAETRYRAIIEAETGPMIDRLIAEHFDKAIEATWSVIAEYADDQIRFIEAIIASISGASEPQPKLANGKNAA